MWSSAMQVMTAQSASMIFTASNRPPRPTSRIATSRPARDSVRKIASVVLVNALSSYVSDLPYEHQWLGIMAPRIVRDVGDIPQLAAMVAPRQLVVVGGVNGAGTTLKPEALEQQFAYSRKIYGLHEATDQFVLANPEGAVKLLNS